MDRSVALVGAVLRVMRFLIIAFALGSFGGAINAAFAMNSMVYNNGVAVLILLAAYAYPNHSGADAASLRVASVAAILIRSPLAFSYRKYRKIRPKPCWARP